MFGLRNQHEVKQSYKVSSVKDQGSRIKGHRSRGVGRSGGSAMPGPMSGQDDRRATRELTPAPREVYDEWQTDSDPAMTGEEYGETPV